MKEHKVDIQKTGRYFTSGSCSEKDGQLYFVLHGYGQLAKFFLQKFEPFATNQRLFVAPEGPNRFYTNGLSGRVGASWMTKEERESDIKDYINFLDKVYGEVLEANLPAKIFVIGFSQGSHTACRWLLNNRSKVDQLILWGGSIPNEIDPQRDVPLLNAMDLRIILGKNDQFLTPNKVEETETHLRKLNLNYRITWYEGSHNIDEETLRRIVNGKAE